VAQPLTPEFSWNLNFRVPHSSLVFAKGAGFDGSRLRFIGVQPFLGNYPQGFFRPTNPQSASPTAEIELKKTPPK